MPLRGTRPPSVLLRRVLAVPRAVRRADARAARKLNARRPVPLVDGALVGLSRAADHGVLWFGLGALLLLAGRPREAARGAASLAAASAAANLVGKQLFGGVRPLVVDVPVGRRLARVPTSPSFPSGHAASAAAFAAGVALENPRVGLAVAPLAAAVAFSRLHVGVHWLSDVVGGAALGAAVAGLGKVLVPARPRHVPVSERTSRPPVDVRPLGDGAGLLVVLNPSAGRDSHRPDPEPLLLQRFPAARVHRLAEGEDLGDVVRSARAGDAPPEVLGVYGGDGTMAVGAGLARAEGMTLLVLPGGTMNHFAKALGLVTIQDALDAAAHGERRDVDVAEVTAGDAEPVTVLNTVSIGLYPEFVAAREKREKVIGKPLAAVLAAFEVVRSTDPFELRRDGRTELVWSYFVGVNREHPRTATPLARRRLDDGQLDIRVLHSGRTPRTRGAVSLALGRGATPVVGRVPGWRAPVVESASTAGVVVGARRPAGVDPEWAHDGESEVFDGEPDGFHEARVRIVPLALRVYSAADDRGHGGGGAGK
ncbi:MULTISPECIES: bifunctional phosphatase PAP2/diacylglycerol kinase family protein [unclassified Rathayibacter]|uniref:bifunctional phosphatase PAP2/diacylglycerol kinase family protein n=1 Tax=unclassified Rathayibacter TaxID=2609250 RepID=UPI001FB2EAF8|nr:MULTISPECIES: bifunctional phosphatase PAP2/diacylglycerol kinase family protein [unclassified Rathayibacter]MCJ1674246.1 phosphatase PAP2 family protein [Rathayibacter sp. VKM Ac-2929]MCJ1684527.1 phosphatase PAP2 family protein [Rathayibacter sp. VKM Ac-2928]